MIFNLYLLSSLAFSKLVEDKDSSLTGKVLWEFYEWKRQQVGAAEFQHGHQSTEFTHNDIGLDNMLSYLDIDQLDLGFWQMLGYEGVPRI